MAHAQCIGDLPGRSVQRQRRFSAGCADNLDIDPTDAVAPACPQRLHGGFFGGKASGEALGPIAVPVAVSDLGGCEDSLQETLAVPVYSLADAVYF